MTGPGPEPVKKCGVRCASTILILMQVSPTVPLLDSEIPKSYQTTVQPGMVGDDTETHVSGYFTFVFRFSGPLEVLERTGRKKET